MNKPKIALFGYYNSDNWGDNLMAMIFAFYLQRHNVPYDAFITHDKKKYYSPFIKNTSETIEELITGKDMIIFGGGGILVPGQYCPVKFSQNLEKLIESCRTKSIPIYALSVGGIGNPSVKLTPPFRDHFLKSVEWATVRNQQDISLLNKYNKKGKFFHDIMWLAPEIFNLKKTRRERLTIGINCQTTYSNLFARLYWKLFKSCLYLSAKKNPDIDYIFIDTKIATSQNKKFSPMGAFKNCPNTKEYKFQEANSDFEMLQGLDILFSDKLHLGLVCLSLGIPFVSVRGQAKTKRMLGNIGLSKYYFGSLRAFLILIMFLFGKYPRNIVQNFRFPNKDPIIKSAQGHFEELSNIIAKHSH